MKNKKSEQKKKSIFDKDLDENINLVLDKSNKESTKINKKQNINYDISQDRSNLVFDKSKKDSKKNSKKQKRNFDIKMGNKKIKKEEETEKIKNTNFIFEPTSVKINKQDKHFSVKVKKQEYEDSSVKINKQDKHSSVKVKKQEDEDSSVKIKKKDESFNFKKKDESSNFKKKDESSNFKKKDDMGVKLSKLETEILQKGTLKDKINLLTLIVEKNPTEQNYKNLLFYAENQRNDVIYLVLKNLKDLLISKGVPKNHYLKQKITKCFEINVRNTFIKHKVVKLIYELLKNNILFMDLVYPFINKIGDKREIEIYVRENLMSLFLINEDALLLNIEDFIFKNMNFKCTNAVLKFLGSVVPSDNEKMIGIYKLILENISGYKDEHRNIILENCLEHLSTLVEGIAAPNHILDPNLEKILINSYFTDKIAFSSFKILYLCRNSNTKIFLVNLIRNNIFVRFTNIKEVVKYIKKIFDEDEDEDFIRNIFNNLICYKKDFLIAILLIILRNKISNLFSLEVFSNHYSNIVRKISNSILSRKYENIDIDPFDKIQLEAYENIFT